MTRSKGRQNQSTTFQPHKSSWSAEEDATLAELVTTRGAKAWCAIASLLGTRTGKQCRERWRNHLDPSVKKGPFTPKEDEILLHLIAVHGSKWSLIARSIPGRTDNAVKNRFNSSLKRVLEKRKKEANRRNTVPTTPTVPSKASTRTTKSPPTSPTPPPRLTPDLRSRRTRSSRLAASQEGQQSTVFGNTLQTVARTPPIDRRFLTKTNTRAKWSIVQQALLPSDLANNQPQHQLTEDHKTSNYSSSDNDNTSVSSSSIGGRWWEEVESNCSSSAVEEEDDDEPQEQSQQPRAYEPMATTTRSAIEDDVNQSLVLSAALGLMAMTNPSF